VSATRRRPPPSARRAARARQRNQGSDLAARVAVAIPAVIVALVGIWVSPATFALLLAVAGVPSGRSCSCSPPPSRSRSC